MKLRRASQPSDAVTAWSKAWAAAAIGFAAALVYAAVFAAAACYPAVIDPIGVVIALPYTASHIGVATFVAVFACFVAAQRAPWKRASFTRVFLATLFAAVVSSAYIAYAAHPVGVPCAI